MDKVIIYYDNTVDNIYDNNTFDNIEDNIYDNNIEANIVKNYNEFVILFVYLAGFYHITWYIINATRYYSYDDLRIKLGDCRTIFRILNENTKMFNEESVETLNTTALLEELLHNYQSENESENESENDSESENENDSDDKEKDSLSNFSEKEIEAAEILTSFGKNWEFPQ
jgi:hypothetical protein